MGDEVAHPATFKAQLGYGDNSGCFVMICPRGDQLRPQLNETFSYRKTRFPMQKMFLMRFAGEGLPSDPGLDGAARQGSQQTRCCSLANNLVAAQTQETTNHLRASTQTC